MYKYSLDWHSNEGVTEGLRVDSETVSPDKAWAAWDATVNGMYKTDSGAGASTLTREQFRQTVKALIGSGDFKAAVGPGVITMDFYPGRGWKCK